MAILRQNEPAKRPSFEAQMVISGFLTNLQIKINWLRFTQQGGFEELAEKFVKDVSQLNNK